MSGSILFANDSACLSIITNQAPPDSCFEVLAFRLPRTQTFYSAYRSSVFLIVFLYMTDLFVQKKKKTVIYLLTEHRKARIRDSGSLWNNSQGVTKCVYYEVQF